MEDSNGYLKKMYEEKILNYEKTQKELKESIDKATKVLETAKETIVRN